MFFSPFSFYSPTLLFKLYGFQAFQAAWERAAPIGICRPGGKYTEGHAAAFVYSDDNWQLVWPLRVLDGLVDRNHNHRIRRCQT